MLLRHLVSIMVLPVSVIGVVPVLLYWFFHFVLFWDFQYHTEISILATGIGLAALGFILLCSTIQLFVKKGEGTIAPWNPTQKLIVTGFYSHVRNPMHIGVFLILTGESAIANSIPLILWTAMFIVGNLIYVPTIEEAKLAERFGDEYSTYKKYVPRWIPRLSSWNPNHQL